MSEILQAILLAPDSFCESSFEDVQEKGLTRAWIMKFIGFDSQSCESNQQFEVVIAIFYHLVDELYARGCCKSEICALAKLTAQYWRESLDRSLQENLQALHATLEPLVPRPVSQRAAEIFLTYTVQSFLRHFTLYRACLAESRRDLRLRRGATVETPDRPMPLREGRRPEEHQYHCHLREIDTEEQLTRAGRTAQRLDESAETARRQQEVRDRVEVAETDDDQYPSSIISDCIDLNLRQMRLRVQDMAANSSIDLIYKAKRTALPRPTSMGPPPRFVASGGGGGGGGGGGERKSAASSRSSAKSRTGGDSGGKKAAAKAK